MSLSVNEEQERRIRKERADLNLLPTQIAPSEADDGSSPYRPGDEREAAWAEAQRWRTAIKAKRPDYFVENDLCCARIWAGDEEWLLTNQTPVYAYYGWPGVKAQDGGPGQLPSLLQALLDETELHLFATYDGRRWTEPPGYSPVRIGWQYDGKRAIASHRIEFASAGGQVTGWLALRDGAVRFAQRFPEGPFNIQAPGQSIRVEAEVSVSLTGAD